jgi:TRAP-type C4-dicarboxylate transport system permease small subunit
MSRFERIYRIFDFLRKAVVTVLFIAVVVICTVDVFMRYLPGLSSLGWAEEILRYFNIWIIFLGASIAAKYGAHLRIYYFTRLTGERNARIINRAVDVIVLVFIAAFIALSLEKAIHNIPQRCWSFPFSIAWFYFALPVGSLYMFVDYLLMLIYGRHPFRDGLTVALGVPE